MGVYDSITVKCPKCKTEIDCQSKSGPCELSYYNLETAPASVMYDANRHAPFKCYYCGVFFFIDTDRRLTIQLPWKL